MPGIVLGQGHEKPEKCLGWYSDSETFPTSYSSIGSIPLAASSSFAESRSATRNTSPYSPGPSASRYAASLPSFHFGAHQIDPGPFDAGRNNLPADLHLHEVTEVEAELFELLDTFLKIRSQNRSCDGDCW